MNPLKPLLRALQAHPAETGEGYFAHARFALGVSLECARIAVITGVHAVLPMYCTRTGSARLRALMERIERRAVQSDDR